MSTITAAAVPLTFLDGSTYQTSPLTDRDIDELDEYVRSQVLENAKKSAETDGTSPEMAKLLISTALEKSVTVTWMSGIGAAMMATPAGMTRLVWQSLKKCHPGLTLEEVWKKLLDPGSMQMNPEAVRRANAAFAQANSVGDDEQRGGTPKGKAGKRQRRARRSTGRSPGATSGHRTR